MQSFNSATTFQPWKLETLRAERVAKLAASIRPRLFSRGNFSSPDVPANPAMASIRPRLFSRGNKNDSPARRPFLQCFNSATTFQPWKHDGKKRFSCNQALASIRPRLFSRGNDQQEADNAHQLIMASIRPRLFSRGNKQKIRFSLPEYHASIRPRLFSRGNQTCHPLNL